MNTPFLAWRDSYAVGHMGLDTQHRQLVELINDIHDAECAINEMRGPARDGLTALLHAFEIAAVNHFKSENAILRRFGEYAEGSHMGDSAFLGALREAHINEHYAEHARALVALDIIIHGSGGDSPRDYGARLKAWFTAHAGGSDRHLKAVFAARL